MKKLIIGAIAGSLLGSGVLYAAPSQETVVAKLQFYVNGQQKQLEGGQPLLQQGKTYVPLRDMAQILDQPVYWDSKTQSVSIGTPYVHLFNGKGEEVGRAVLKQEANGVTIKLKATGLTPGKHGFHIHEKKFEAFDFKSAGGHFNPHGKKHGHDNPEGMHAGDMPNLEVQADGTADVEVFIEHGTLEKGNPLSLLGRSIIIHAKEDDGKTDPAGNAGDRIVGGAIPE